MYKVEIITRYAYKFMYAKKMDIKREGERERENIWYTKTTGGIRQLFAQK